jgi:G3E family GTPase
MNTKVSIVSGFLGAGKTTFIKKLLQEQAFGTKPMLIENDFGSLGIDGAILESTGVRIEEISSGCICCTLIGAFTQALKKLIVDYQPENIIIEPSGVGKLSEIISYVKEVQEELPVLIDKVVTIVDAKRFDHNEKYVTEYFENQIKNAKTVVLSKTQGLTGEQLLHICNQLKEIHPEGDVVSISWDIPFKPYLHSLEGEAQAGVIPQLAHEHHHDEHGECCGHEHHHHHEGEECEHEHHHHYDENGDCECGHHHSHEDGCGHHHEHEHDHGIFEYYSFDCDKQFTVAELEELMRALEDEQKYGVVVRSKGVVTCGSERKLFDYVPGEGKVSDIQTEKSNRALVIGTNLNKENLYALFGYKE